MGTSPSTCEWYFSEGFDGGKDASGNVFSAMEFFEADICPSSETREFLEGTGIEYADSPSAQPTLTPPPSSGIDDIYYMDVDNSDNIWFDYYSCVSVCGYALGEVQNATTSPVWVTNIASLGFAGGVYVGTRQHAQRHRPRCSHDLALLASGLGALSALGPTKRTC